MMTGGTAAAAPAATSALLLLAAEIVIVIGPSMQLVVTAATGAKNSVHATRRCAMAASTEAAHCLRLRSGTACTPIAIAIMMTQTSGTRSSTSTRAHVAMIGNATMSKTMSRGSRNGGARMRTTLAVVVLHRQRNHMLAPEGVSVAVMAIRLSVTGIAETMHTDLKNVRIGTTGAMIAAEGMAVLTTKRAMSGGGR